MKKFIVVAIILICCCLYGIIKLSTSESENANGAAETNQSTKSINAGHTDVVMPSEETQSAKQISADNTDKAKPEEGSDSPIPATAAQVEAVTKAYSEFIIALKSEDYEQAWMLVSKVVKSEMSFEEFKKGMAAARNELVNAIMHQESAINLKDRVGLLIGNPEDEQYYFFFIQEDGQWKFSGPEPAKNVDVPKE